MIIKASERLALILAAGLLLASPVQAATDGDDFTPDSKSGSAAAPVTHRTFRHAWHHRKHYAHHRPHVIAAKTDTDKKATVADAAPDDNKVLPSIPPSIANANAQMLLANAQTNAAAAIPAGTTFRPRPPATKPTPVPIMGPSWSRRISSTMRIGRCKKAVRRRPRPPVPPPAPATTMTGESTALDKTSLIGKIFIGFGALLTMASAARMFIT